MKFKLMTREEINFIKKLLLLFGIMHLIVVILVLLPRQHTRRVRHALAIIPLMLWASFSRLFALGHDVLWQKGNGH